jgi:glucose/arabinose dehydrogenase
MHVRVFGVLVALLAFPATAEVESTDAVSPCLGVSTTANTSLAAVTVVTGLVEPLFVTAPPGDTQRIFIVERRGRILIHPRGTPTTNVTTFLDIQSVVDHESGGEMGLLGLAFDPGYASTLSFWVTYSTNINNQPHTVVSRFSTSATDPNVANPASEVRILAVPQPQTYHLGGMMAFGPDGFLYVTRGDSGISGDNVTCGVAQNRGDLLGKVLRLDVRGIDPDAEAPDCGGPSAIYGVPASNPLADGPGGNCDEIWAYGLRNPWRGSFDKLTGDFYVADVGESCWEEVNFQPSASAGGQNYGWRKMEGTHCFSLANPFNCDPPGDVCPGTPLCQDPSLTRPVHEYPHGQGCTIIGGYAYRGCRMTAWQGTYFYGDYCVGFVKGFEVVGGVAIGHVDVTSQVAPGALVSSFGQDGQGELYITKLGGSVLKIVPPLADLEVSATGAASRFLLSKTSPWTWENLTASTDVPVSFYRVYRGTPNGSYTCVIKATQPMTAAGGDPANPASGQLFAYVVVAVDGTGQETTRGTTGTFNPATCP